MRFILQNGNIYATNLKYMNDSEEYSNGLIEVRKILNEHYEETKKTIDEAKLRELLKGHTEYYSISFSTQRDLLSQWSMYAGESGVSLKLNFENKQNYKFYAAGKEKQEERKYSVSNVKPRRVYYVTQSSMEKEEYDSVKEKILEEIEERYDPIVLGDLESENAIKVWQDMTPYVKRYEFYQEGEFRLAYSSWDFPDALRIDYRNDRHVLKPYLDVECENGWPVEEIIVGPGFNQHAVFTSLTHYMEHADLKIPEVNSNVFVERCEMYFQQKKKIPDKVQKMWNAYKNRLGTSDVDARYKLFETFKREIMEATDISKDYKKHLSNKHLSKYGVLITKSEIPYKY